MRTLTGKYIKAIPVPVITPGLKVMWEAATGVLHTGKVIGMRDETYVDIAYSKGGHVTINRDNLKTLIIYHVHIKMTGGDLYHPHMPMPFVNEYPLKYSDWETVIDKGLVNLYKEIEFELTKVYVEPPDSIHSNRGADIEVATIVLTPIKEYNKEDIVRAYELGRYEARLSADQNNYVNNLDMYFKGITKELQGKVKIEWVINHK